MDSKTTAASHPTGYILSGALTITYSDGSEEVDTTGDMFYWPPGHTLRADEDTDFVLFSPQHEHGEVIEQIRTNIEQST